MWVSPAQTQQWLIVMTADALRISTRLKIGWWRVIAAKVIVASNDDVQNEKVPSLTQPKKWYFVFDHSSPHNITTLSQLQVTHVPTVL